MKLTRIFSLLMIMLVVVGLCSCDFGGEDPITIVEFDVDESKLDMCSVGDTYEIKNVAVLDSKDNYHMATITVTDPQGNDVTVTNGKITCSKAGQYTITYTVTLEGSEPVSKSYKVEAVDVTEPTIEATLKDHSITTKGATFDLSTINVTDNSGETIVPTVKVFFNGEEITVEGNIITFDQDGTYTIEVTASDSYDNEAIVEYNVYTKLDFESGKYFNNQWYPTEISDKVAYTGTHAYSFGVFVNAPSWFNDYSMLGEIFLYETTARKVSFWVYFDYSGLDFTGSVLTNAIYHQLEVYNVYGEALSLNWQNKYEFAPNTWYRFVVDMDTMVMIGDTKDRADAAPVVESLLEIPFFFGSWDITNGANAAKGVPFYIDDIRLIGDVDDEVYAEKPPHACESVCPECGKCLDAACTEAVCAEKCDCQKPDPEPEPEPEPTPGEVTLQFSDIKDAVYNANGWAEGPFYRFTLAYGTYTNYVSMAQRPESTFGDWIVGSPDGHAEVSGWRFKSGYNEGILYVVEATSKMTVELIAPENINGWLDGSAHLVIVVRRADGTLDVLRDTMATKDVCSYEPVTLEAGDTFIFEYRFEWQDYRIVENPSYLKLVNASEPTPEPEPEPTPEPTEITLQYSAIKDAVYVANGWAENDLAKFTMAYGSYTSYAPMAQRPDSTYGDWIIGSPDGHAEASGWQFKSGHNEGVLYVVEAKEKMTVQLVATNEINAWFDSSSHVVIVVRRADGTLEVIRDTMDTGKDVFSCEPVTLEAGDTFIFEFRFEWGDYRNLQNPPYMIFSNNFAE